MILKSALKSIASNLSWLRFAVIHRVKVKFFALYRLFVKPRLPKRKDGKVLIHLGCGFINIPGFINVDMLCAPHIHYRRNVSDLPIFNDDFADMVYACHVLEHIPRPNLEKTLWEWRRILKQGGILRLSVPDFDKLVHIYESCSRNITHINKQLMGGQNNQFNIHYLVFNHEYLRKKLSETGFRIIREWECGEIENQDFQDMANIKIVIEGREFPVSLNLEAVK